MPSKKVKSTYLVLTSPWQWLTFECANDIKRFSILDAWQWSTKGWEERDCVLPRHCLAACIANKETFVLMLTFSPSYQNVSCVPFLCIPHVLFHHQINAVVWMPLLRKLVSVSHWYGSPLQVSMALFDSQSSKGRFMPSSNGLMSVSLQLSKQELSKIGMIEYCAK